MQGNSRRESKFDQHRTMQNPYVGPQFEDSSTSTRVRFNEPQEEDGFRERQSTRVRFNELQEEAGFGGRQSTRVPFARAEDGNGHENYIEIRTNRGDNHETILGFLSSEHCTLTNALTTLRFWRSFFTAVFNSLENLYKEHVKPLIASSSFVQYITRDQAQTLEL